MLSYVCISIDNLSFDEILSELSSTLLVIFFVSLVDWDKHFVVNNTKMHKLKSICLKKHIINLKVKNANILIFNDGYKHDLTLNKHEVLFKHGKFAYKISLLSDKNTK